MKLSLRILVLASFLAYSAQARMDCKTLFPYLAMGALVLTVSGLGYELSSNQATLLNTIGKGIELVSGNRYPASDPQKFQVELLEVAAYLRRYLSGDGRSYGPILFEEFSRQYPDKK